MVDTLPNIEGDHGRIIEATPVALFDLAGNYAGSGAAVPAGNATATSSRVTTAGNTTDGAFSIAVANDGAADGTFGGAVLKAGQSLSLDNSNGINAIAYDATGTEFLIVEIA